MRFLEGEREIKTMITMPKIWIAQREHKCGLCRKPIVKGEPFIMTGLIGGGSNVNYPVHPQCDGWDLDELLERRRARRLNEYSYQNVETRSYRER